MSSPQRQTVCYGNVRHQYVLGVSLTPVAVATVTCAEQSFTVQGLSTVDVVAVTNGLAQTAGVGIVGAWVSAANTLTVNFCNPTAGSVTPVSGIHYITVYRVEGAPAFPSVIA